MSEKQAPPSRLIAVLREGVGIVQMILYKEIKRILSTTSPDLAPSRLSMLSGAITNSLFGVVNPEQRFQEFFRENRGTIEQELLGLAAQLPGLCPLLTDALRIQTLCDHQEEIEAPDLLRPAAALGILVEERDLPLPSTFMALVRSVGEEHGLLIAPVEVRPEDEQALIH